MRLRAIQLLGERRTEWAAGKADHVTVRKALLDATTAKAPKQSVFEINGEFGTQSYRVPITDQLQAAAKAALAVENAKD